MTLADHYETKNTVITKPESVCTPADKNGEGMTDPTVALTCYRIKSVPGQTRFAPRDAAITNQFGNITVTATKARTLCVPSSLE